MEEKKEFRKVCLMRRDQIQDRESKSRKIVNRIIQSSAYCKSTDIMAYVPIHSEVDITGLLLQILADQKKLYLPKTYVETGCMEFFRVRDLSELIKGAYHIPEPVCTEPFDSSKSALILVPGVAYDERGYRMGYGGGYYDRFLYKKRSNWITMMPAFYEQKVSELPIEKTDQKIDFIITQL